MKNRATETFFFDLDGTLLNQRRRLYTLFVELTKSEISYDNYWKLKEEGMNQKKMLEKVRYTETSPETFARLWKDRIETPSYLQMDILFEDVIDVLGFFKARQKKLYVVTNRQSYSSMYEELKALDVLPYFNKIVTTYQRCSKAEAVLKSGIATEKAVFVGDSKEDMETAAVLRIPGILVERNKNKIEIKADYVISHLEELKGFLS